MKNRRNYYRILHVQPDAPVEVIRSSYRTIMQKLRAHPDLGGDDWNAALINEAYAVVTDAARRAEYDASMASPVQRARGDHPGSTTPPVAEHISCSFCQTLQRRQGAWRTVARCVRCNSPLAPVVPLVLEHSCKRAIARMTAHERVEFFSEWPQPRPHRGMMTDLSLNGLGVQSPLALTAGTVIKLDSALLSATGTVVNCQPEQRRTGRYWHLGIAFLALEFADLCGTFVSART